MLKVAIYQKNTKKFQIFHFFKSYYFIHFKYRRIEQNRRKFQKVIRNSQKMHFKVGYRQQNKTKMIFFAKIILKKLIHNLSSYAVFIQYTSHLLTRSMHRLNIIFSNHSNEFKSVLNLANCVQKKLVIMKIQLSFIPPSSHAIFSKS